MNIIRLNKNNPECIVFFNPMASDSCFWKNNLPDDLASKYEIIFIDYPGYNSEFAPFTSFRDLSDHIDQEVLSKLNKPFHLVGYSYGGFLAQHLVQNNYENIKSVVLVGCSYKLTPKDKETNSVLGKIIEDDLYLFCRLLTLFSHNPEEINENALIGLQKFSNLKLTVNDAKPILQQISHLKKMGVIEQNSRSEKTLIIYGENDKMIDTAALDTFHTYFKNLEILKLPNEAHIIDTEKVYAHITQFLN